MKKFFLIPVLILTFFSFSSCEDESLNPLPVKVNGQFMKLDIYTDHKQMDFNDKDNTYFGGVLSCPANNVSRYELQVRRTDASGELTGDYVPLLVVTSFPYDLRITPAQVAAALGLSVDDLEDGDSYRFFGYSYDANGHMANYRSLASIVRTTSAMEQGYRFNTSLTSLMDPNYNNRVIN